MPFIIQPTINEEFNHGSKSNILNVSKNSLSGYKNIGYYTNSDSPFSNAAWNLLKYNALGNMIIPFTDLGELDSFVMVIVPYKENWSSDEINNLKNFTEGGGIALLTQNCPSELLNVTIGERNGFWAKCTDLFAQTTSDKDFFRFYANYSEGYYSVNTGDFTPYDNYSYAPYHTFRPTRYITSLDESSIDILFTAHLREEDSQNIGYSVVSKKVGMGRIAFSSIALFDFWGLRGIGGPIMPDGERGTLWITALRTSQIIDRLLVRSFLMEEKIAPLRWHTPYAKRALILSRDDVDSYYKTSAVIPRGTVDQNHGIPSIFYELSTAKIPESDWDEVLNVSSKNPLGYHFSGYHRHTAYEASAEAYLSRILEIEGKTGMSCYFECHHGAGSGFFGQNYVRTAIEATNNLSHFVLYNSGEGTNSGECNYIEPRLYLLENSSVVLAKNYYGFPKTKTIDSMVSGNSWEDFQSYIENTCFLTDRHPHWLLHSQNVRNKIYTNYDNLLTKGIDPIINECYTNPLKFVELSLNYVENVTMSFQGTNDTLQALVHCNNDIEGFTFAIPLSENINIFTIRMDGVLLDKNLHRLIDHGSFRLFLFHSDLIQGPHNLEIIFEVRIPTSSTGSSIPEFPSNKNSIFSLLSLFVALGLITQKKLIARKSYLIIH